jgi:hypothetical protein
VSSHTGDADPHGRLVAREFFAAALYMALVQLAAVIALPTRRLPSDETVVSLLLGTAVGLVLAHWLAFRLAAHVTTESGYHGPSAAREAAAQIGGGLSVGVLAAVPFLLRDGEDALEMTIVVLAALPAAIGLAIARLRGYSWLASLLTSVAVLGVALAAVAVKAAAGH